VHDCAATLTAMQTSSKAMSTRNVIFERNFFADRALALCREFRHKRGQLTSLIAEANGDQCMLDLLHRVYQNGSRRNNQNSSDREAKQ
jgi:hypothetical protein